MKITGGAVAALGGVVLAGVAIYLLARKGSDAAGAVADALNPTSDKNLAYRGVNAVGAAATGQDDFSLGSWLYNTTHTSYNPDQPGVNVESFDWGGALDLATLATMPGINWVAKTAYNADWSFINPASDQNIFYGGVNSVGSAVTGDGNFSLGSWFYDLVHR